LKAALLVALSFAALPLFADNVLTRCHTTVVNFIASDTQPWDVRRLGACDEHESENALWHLDRLDSADGNLDGHFSRLRANALVYVIDTGVETDHDEFADGNVIAGLDVVPLGINFPAGTCAQPDSVTHPCVGGTLALTSIQTHGTGVASVIAGRNVGVSPGASIVAVRISSNDPAKWINALNAVIQHAWNPATPQVRTAIVNMSNQISTSDLKNAAVAAKLEQKYLDMVFGVDQDGNRDANGKRFFFTVAAGNAAAAIPGSTDLGQCGPNLEVKLYPATLGASVDGILTVGGMTAGNRIWAESCRGGVEILAPAEHVLVASNTGRFDYRSSQDSGTSWSAPITAGVAAWLLTMHPEMSPAEIEQTLKSSGSSIEGISVVNIVPAHGARRRGVAH
jgi:subtilisin family serine protease